ncbi:MAG: nuclear transport factor 2 family protein, partial [Bacteroidota bacterium]
PLRVALRGASGGQSQQAHQIFQAAKEAFSNYLSLISDKELTVMTILERPADFPYLLSVINHFTKLERVLKNFFFQHYVLSSGIIGSQSFGSIGYDLVSLVDKFVEPIFKEIDQAKYDLTLKTNFAYGDISGSLIARKEGDYSLEGNISKADSNLTETTIGNYFEAISKLDMDLWLSQFNENGYIEDPVGSRPYLGHQQLKIFFKGVVRFFTKLNMTIESIIDDGMYTSVRWKAKATTYHEKQLQFEGEEVFGFCENGKILTATVHWNPAVISEQL